jgi:hypothetical protein
VGQKHETSPEKQTKSRRTGDMAQVVEFARPRVQSSLQEKRKEEREGGEREEGRRESETEERKERERKKEKKTLKF